MFCLEQSGFSHFGENNWNYFFYYFILGEKIKRISKDKFQAQNSALDFNLFLFYIKEHILIREHKEVVRVLG